MNRLDNVQNYRCLLIICGNTYTLERVQPGASYFVLK